MRAPAQHFEVEIARSSEVFVLVACDVESAHIYAAVLFSGGWERHAYWRVGNAVMLDPGSNMKFQHCEKVRHQKAHERARVGTYQASQLAGRAPTVASQFESPKQPPREQSPRTKALEEETRARMLREDEVASTRRLKRSLSETRQAFDGLGRRTREVWGSVFDDYPWVRTQWEHFMLYGVREGVIGHFGASLDQCAEAMASIIASSGRRPSLCLAHRVGTVAMTRDLVTTMNADLRRTFKVKTEDHMLRQSTNCVLFVMRVLKTLNLPLRGLQLQEAAAAQPGVGRAAGEVLAQAWEYLWNRVDM